MPLSSLLPSIFRSAAKESPTAVKGAVPLSQKFEELTARLTQVQKEGDTVILKKTEAGKDLTTRAERKKFNKEGRKLQKALHKLIPTDANPIIEAFKGTAKEVTQNNKSFLNKVIKSINKALSTLTKPFRYIYQQLKKLFNRGASAEQTAATQKAEPATKQQEQK